MNTHAPDSLLHASQGDVAHEVPTHGKQQGAHGQIGSAGFAQILGEQVTKSTPKAEAAEMASEPFLPQAVPPSSTHATDHSSPQSLPAAHEKPAPRVIAQVRQEGSEQTPPTLAHALPKVGQRLAYEEHRTSSLTQQVHIEKPEQRIPVGPSTGLQTTVQRSGKPEVTPSRQDETSPSVARNAQLATDVNKVTLSPVGTANGSTETQRPEHQTAAIPSARAGDVVDKSTSKTESLVQRTITPNAEAPSTKTAQGTVHHDKVRPARQQPGTIRVLGTAPDTLQVRLPARDTTAPSNDASATTARAPELSASVEISASVQIPTGHISSVPSRPARMPARSGSAFANQGPKTADMNTLEGSPNLPAMVRAERSSAAPRATNMDTLEGVPPPSASQTSVARGTDSHAHIPSTVPTSQMLNEHAHASTKNHERSASEAAPSTGSQEEHTPVATQANRTVRVSDRVSVESIEHVSRVATKASETTVPLPTQTGNIVAHVTSAKPGDSEASALSESGQSVAALPSSSSESAPPTTLPLPSPHSLPQADAAKHAPISPNLHPEIPAETTPRGTGSELFAGRLVPHEDNPEATEHPVPEEKGRNTVEHPVRVNRHVDANPTPAHVQKPLHQSAGAQVLPDPPAISPPVPQPVSQANPAIVSQNLPATQVARDPKSASVAFRPTATATAKVAVATPTSDQAQASVRQEDEPAESTTETWPAVPSVRQTGISSQDTNHHATDTPLSVKQSPASPTQAASQARNRSTAPVEPAAEKRRIQAADEKESVEALAAPATSPQATPLPATPSPTLGIENKPSRSEALRSAEHKTIADNTSQTSTAPSTASQAHATKPDFAPVILSSADRPVTFPLPPTFIPANGEASVQEAAAPSPLAAERAGLVDRAIADPGLSVTVMPHSAHLSIAGDAGDLALHVRVRDGSADVNVSGTMAPLFDAKAPEVRTVLAGQGLQLGSFATDQRGHSQSQQGNPESAPRTNDLPPPPPRRNNTSTPEVQIAEDRRIHVTA